MNDGKKDQKMSKAPCVKIFLLNKKKKMKKKNGLLKKG